MSLEHTTTGECIAEVDPASVRVWGSSMDYLDTGASFSYKVIYFPVGRNISADEKELVSAQQVVLTHLFLL